MDGAYQLRARHSPCAADAGPRSLGAGATDAGESQAARWVWRHDGPALLWPYSALALFNLIGIGLALRHADARFGRE